MVMRRLARLTIAVTLLLAAMPFASEAQGTGKVYRIGLLETTPQALNVANFDAFPKGLRELGYIEGQKVLIEYRSAEGRHDRAADLATELVRLKVDVIVTRGTPAVLAAKHASSTIPIVMAASGDPVGTGVVASLARPGSNVTGLSGSVVELSAKRIELLREMVPQLSRVAGLFDMSDPVNPPEWKEAEMAARSWGLEAQLLDVRKPEDLRRAFESAIKQRADAIVVGSAALTRTNLRAIATLAATHRLPAIFQSREFVDAGGLMSYG